MLQAAHAALQQQLSAKEVELAAANQEGSKLAAQRQELDRQYVKANQAIQVSTG